MAKKQQYRKKDNSEALRDILEAGGRIPPQAIDIEEAVLGSMLIETEAASIAIQALKAEDFYKPAHKMIFESILRLHEKNNSHDILTVASDLDDKNILENIGGTGYLTQLTRSVSSAANIEYHAQIIAEKSLKRKLIVTATEIIQDTYDSELDTFELLDSAEKRIFDIADTKRRNSGQDIQDILIKTLEYIVEIRGQSGGLTGVPSSLDVDKMTAGWQRGDLIIIAARPSMGKTAFILTAARNAALHNNKDYKTGVAFFSLEMSSQSLVQRLLTMEAGVDGQKTRSGQISSEEFEQLVSAAGKLSKADIFIDDTPGISLMELRSKCRRLKQEHNIGMVVVDYLQLMTAGTNHDGNREQEIAYISRGLKGLAKELDLPVVALAQLSRQVENRGPNKRPMLSDLRESGSIEQDADVVCFLYRPEYYDIREYEGGESTKGVAEIIIGKQRNGPTGTVRLHFIEKFARFQNLTNIYSDNDFGYIEGDSAYIEDSNNSSDENAPF